MIEAVDHGNHVWGSGLLVLARPGSVEKLVRLYRLEERKVEENQLARHFQRIEAHERGWVRWLFEGTRRRRLIVVADRLAKVRALALHRVISVIISEGNAAVVVVQHSATSKNLLSNNSAAHLFVVHVKDGLRDLLERCTIATWCRHTIQKVYESLSQRSITSKVFVTQLNL